MAGNLKLKNILWLVFCLSCFLGGAAFAYPTNSITLTFNCSATNLGPVIPDNFIGMALSRTFINGANASAQVFNPTWNPGTSTTTWKQFTNILGQIGIHHWRTIDDATGIYTDPTPAQDNQFFTTLKDSGVSNVIYALHGFCESAPPNDDITAATNILLNATDASLLESFALDNEPNFNENQECPTTPAWTEQEYEAQWNMVFTGIEAGIVAAGLPEAPFSGPEGGGGSTPSTNTPNAWLPFFAVDEATNQYYIMATEHNYDANAQPTSPNAIQMAITNLSPDRVSGWMSVYANVLGGAANWPKDVHGNKLRYEFTEASAFDNGGGTGAPDGNTNGENFSTALWELDFCHWWAQKGCAGVNPFNRPVDYSAPIQLSYSTGLWTAMPYAYGLKAFNMGGRGLPFTNTAAFFSNPGNMNATAYGVLSTNGTHLYITVINKTCDAVGAVAANVTIPAPANFYTPTNAQYLLLSDAPAGQEGNATNVQTAFLGGGTITNVGPWNGTWSALTLNHGQVNLIVQPSTAVVIDLQGSSTPAISMARSGNNVTITYNGMLLSATGVKGPYNPVIGATSPYAAPITNTQEFYRAQSLPNP